MTRIAIWLAVAAFAALPLACGDGGDDAEAGGDRAATIGEPALVTNDEDEPVDGGEAAEGGEAGTGLTEGQPPLDVLEQVDPALPSTLSEDRSSCGTLGLVPDAGNIAQIDETVVCLLNAERASRGLDRLRRNARLDRGALVHSRDMVERQYFAHVSPEGKRVDARLRAAGYIPRRAAFVVGENLGFASGTSSTPDAIVQAWMQSASHRANILHPRYREIGIGTAIGSPNGGDGGATFTTTFGVINRPRRR